MSEVSEKSYNGGKTFMAVPAEPAFEWLKFRRQHPLGRYIADFYCAEAGLVIELEGKVHSKAEQREYDRIRKEELEARGLRVMRFNNEEMLNRTEKVLAKIVAVASERHLTP